MKNEKHRKYMKSDYSFEQKEKKKSIDLIRSLVILTKK